MALVKKYQNVVTLAMGDGANDINMIKSGWRQRGPGGWQQSRSGGLRPLGRPVHVPLQLQTSA